MYFGTALLYTLRFVHFLFTIFSIAFKGGKNMWKYLTIDTYNEFLLSFNLLKTKDIKHYKKTLYYLSNNIDGNYIEYEKLKKNGNFRTIYEPSKLLKKVQRNILHNILEEKGISKYATAYKKGVSLKDNALPHINNKIILKLDIKNFFDNITFNKVYNLCFKEEIYTKPFGILLTKLCTYNNKLPQGAPTSSYISNIIMRDFDEVVGKYCTKNKINYTRYSDDLTFSGIFNINDVINLVKKELKKKGFKLNYDKIHVIKNNKRQIVTGIIVNKKINISKEYKRKIRQEIYYIKKYGIERHLKMLNINNKTKYLNNLLGRINYVIQITHSKEFLEYKAFLDSNKINFK